VAVSGLAEASAIAGVASGTTAQQEAAEAGATGAEALASKAAAPAADVPVEHGKRQRLLVVVLLFLGLLLGGSVGAGVALAKGKAAQPASSLALPAAPPPSLYLLQPWSPQDLTGERPWCGGQEGWLGW